MILALFLTFAMATGSGPMDSALRATEAPKTFRAAFTVELKSEHARRVYSFDPRKDKDERWAIVDWSGDDEELDSFGANWAAEAAPDGRLFPDDLRLSLGPHVQVNDSGAAWALQFRHTPSANDEAFDVWAAQRLAATAWLDPIGERFLRIDYVLPAPVRGPEGGKLTRYNQSYFLRTEPTWSLSYVSGFSIDLEARAAFRTIKRRYSARVTQAEFFFASEQAEQEFVQMSALNTN